MFENHLKNYLNIIVHRRGNANKKMVQRQLSIRWLKFTIFILVSLVELDYFKSRIESASTTELLNKLCLLYIVKVLIPIWQFCSCFFDFCEPILLAIFGHADTAKVSDWSTELVADGKLKWIILLFLKNFSFKRFLCSRSNSECYGVFA